MTTSSSSRRHALKVMGASVGAAMLPAIVGAAPRDKAVPAPAFTYCLNMSTIKGHKLGFVKELEVASKAGFGSVEIWMDSLQAYLDGGGTLPDARKRLDDLGLTVENAIGFAQWIVDDEATRKQGVEQLKREMDQLAQLGCRRTAAPPVGATQQPGLDLKRAAERYRAILELGDRAGVVPHLEMWGFSQNLSRLSDVLYVATESGHPAARLLLDVYHLYKGNSSLDSLPLVGKAGIEIFHVNDYPATLSPAAITDADRLFTGDGVAPLSRILQSIRTPGRPLVISLEVFNKTYYAQDALQVAQTGLAKMKAMTSKLG
ncbi:sugar phosphate isomerase/epimerase [Pontibacter ummariensis]|uniref:Sugar phosphate isomerase/epimerase n=1 Tax=Pontibacter ummariensis TaxID=1610492 RepID=A0A239DDM9_9BACT|nr:sugar phosphate isomerase/epimerase family protein [Pontibacter ummariensis]PRY14346.1 sugar phosphate isomerase/epimerase [Pontibacter ummariensis]SNS29773.1 Sugar phosphate isomerase/epimerase [Pontibacter ummariensis]